MARPKGTVKYYTQQQRKAARTVSCKKTIAPTLRAKYFRLVIPNLQQFTPNSSALNKLKGDTLMLLLQKQKAYGLQFYKLAAQTHFTTGVPHLDILLCYSKSVQKSLRRYDYLIKPGHLTKYAKLNQAILTYGDKQDPTPLSNFPSDSSLILKKQQIQQDPYAVMQVQMLKDPFHFNAHQWLSENKLAVAISKTNWPKAISLLRHQQQVQCNKILHDKPGFKLITNDLIKQVLSRREQAHYRKAAQIYEKITQKLNEITQFGFNRPHKTKHLFLVGPTDIGKTTLARKIQQFVSVYHHGVHNWFPSYKSNIYKMILWNQFSLHTMPYPQLLNFLEGMPMDLQYKGGSVLKYDNQLIFMTSNMSLEEHICKRFKAQQSRVHARANLRARIQQIIIPQGIDLFLLLKLIK